MSLTLPTFKIYLMISVLPRFNAISDIGLKCVFVENLPPKCNVQKIVKVFLSTVK